MRVLVTGAAGFIGDRLVADRVRRGDDVVAFDVKEGDWPAPAHAVVADLGSERDLEGALEKVDVVFHLAAAHLDQSTPDSEYRRVNIDCVRSFIRLARKAGVRRFVHCSTVGVYGSVAKPPAMEDGPKNPGNIYEKTKLEGEHAALEEARKVGLEVVLVRPAWVYGPTCPRTRRLLRMVGRGKFFYFGKGKNLRHPIHIDDMLEGFELAAGSARSGATYNIAGNRALALREMIDTIARAMGVGPPRLRVPHALGWCAAVAAEILCRPLGIKPPLTRRSLMFFANNNSYSIRAAEADLGFRPRVELDEGMRRVVEELGGPEAILS